MSSCVHVYLRAFACCGRSVFRACTHVCLCAFVRLSSVRPSMRILLARRSFPLSLGLPYRSLNAHHLAFIARTCAGSVRGRPGKSTRYSATRPCTPSCARRHEKPYGRRVVSPSDGFLAPAEHSLFHRNALYYFMRLHTADCVAEIFAQTPKSEHAVRLSRPLCSC